jgi:hypothetical protein
MAPRKTKKDTQETEVVNVAPVVEPTITKVAKSKKVKEVEPETETKVETKVTKSKKVKEVEQVEPETETKVETKVTKSKKVKEVELETETKKSKKVKEVEPKVELETETKKSKAKTEVVPEVVTVKTKDKVEPKKVKKNSENDELEKLLESKKNYWASITKEISAITEERDRLEVIQRNLLSELSELMSKLQKNDSPNTFILEKKETKNILAINDDTDGTTQESDDSDESDGESESFSKTILATKQPMKKKVLISKVESDSD